MAQRYLLLSLVASVAAQPDLSLCSSYGRRQSPPLPRPGSSRSSTGPIYNVKDYGAVGDGIAIDTPAFAAASAAAAGPPGGTVLAPIGCYLIGSFNITGSNVTLRVDGAILGSTRNIDYSVLPPLPYYGGANEWQSVVHVVGANGFTLTGDGYMDGLGSAWWGCYDTPSAPPCLAYTRPNLVRIVDSVDVDVNSLELRDSAGWTLHLANVSRAHVWNLTILSPPVPTARNTDGLDVSCSDNVVFEDSYYSGGDDAVSIKSGYDWFGRTYGRPSENILVQRISVGTALGMAVGSETSAGVNNVTFKDLTFNGTSAVIRLKSQRGRGGVVRNISYVNLSLVNCGTAVGMTLNYHTLPPTNATGTPQMYDITVRNLTSHGAQASYSLFGLNDSTIHGITLQDVRFFGSVKEYIECSFVQGVCLGDTNACPKCFGNGTAGG